MTQLGRTEGVPLPPGDETLARAGPCDSLGEWTSHLAEAFELPPDDELLPDELLLDELLLDELLLDEELPPARRRLRSRSRFSHLALVACRPESAKFPSRPSAGTFILRAPPRALPGPRAAILASPSISTSPS